MAVAKAKALASHRHLATVLLHARIRSGDWRACEKLAKRILPSVTRWLAARFPHAERRIIANGATDAILFYLGHVGEFDPEKGTLQGFVRIIAWRNVCNQMRDEQRRRLREQLVAEEILDSMAGAGSDDDGAGETKQLEASWRARREQFARFLGALNRTDRRVMKLRQQGEKRRGEFARVLGISHLPPKQQKVQVDLTKNRLIRAARRWLRAERERERET